MVRCHPKLSEMTESDILAEAYTMRRKLREIAKIIEASNQVALTKREIKLISKLSQVYIR